MTTPAVKRLTTNSVTTRHHQNPTGAPPTVLVLAGHDPGGAGIQADIETLLALGCRAASLVTCLTTQNSRLATERLATPPDMLLRQADALLGDIHPPAACKIGLIPDLGVLDAVRQILDALPASIPVVLDPVLGATAGGVLVDPLVAPAIGKALVDNVLIATPNASEARRLGWPGNDAPDWTLVTGADEPGETIEHKLFRGSDLYASSAWARLPGRYHGSGCSLASAVAGFLARGESVATATAHALDWTWRALLTPLDRGAGHLLPGRPVDSPS